MLKKQTSPVILAINKIDQLNDLGRLLPLLQSLHEKMKFAEIIPISAKTGSGVDDIEKMALRHLPAQTALFPEDQVTDRTERFMVAELIREQIFRNFGQELPYVSTVGIEQFQREQRLIRIEAVIWVEKPGQKVILIGENGIRLKEIGQRARLAMQKLLASKVYLGLWVKVRDGWSDDIKALRSLGYNED